MRSLSILALVLACTACASQPNPVIPPTGEGTGTAATTAQPPANQPPCTSYTVPVTVGGQEQQSVVESCQQPDGSWRITQNTPGLPPQVYVIPPPTEYPYAYPHPDYYSYPSYYPYYPYLGHRALVFWARADDRSSAKVSAFPRRVRSRFSRRSFSRWFRRWRRGQREADIVNRAEALRAPHPAALPAAPPP